MNKLARSSLYLATLAILALPTTANAAPFTWTGFYIGGNAGAGFGGDSTSVDLEGFNYFVANPVPGEVTRVGDDSAFIGGGQLGYNHAFNTMVAGIEADFLQLPGAPLGRLAAMRFVGRIGRNARDADQLEQPVQRGVLARLQLLQHARQLIGHGLVVPSFAVALWAQCASPPAPSKTYWACTQIRASFPRVPIAPGMADLRE